MYKSIWFSLLALMTLVESSIFVEKNEATTPSDEDNYALEMLDLLGLTEQKKKPIARERMPRNSASKFLLEVYNDLQEEDQNYGDKHKRRRRSMRHDDDDNFITQLDRRGIDHCNDIISFSSKAPASATLPQHPNDDKIALNFNTNDVPRELQLVHAVLRIYQAPALGIYQQEPARPLTISVYKRIYNRKQQTQEFRILTSINTTTHYKGWLELNVSHVLAHWLEHRTLHHALHGNDIYIDAALLDSSSHNNNPRSFGLVPVLVTPNNALVDMQPFIIGYFNGPELLVKMQKLRFKRELIKRKRQIGYYPRPAMVADDSQVKPCERLNFTLEFRELELHKTIIAPKKFEAFFCGGQCNFPLGAKMNATNHAIVQTLMHLKKPHLPKPCCVPTVLGSISILYYLNEDSVNLKKIPQSVAKECGCH